MTEFTLACKNISTRKGLHETLAKVMDFPDYYGGNLDALHDVLTEISEATLLIIEDYPALEGHLGKYAASFMRVLKDAAYENDHLTIEYK